MEATLELVATLPLAEAQAAHRNMGGIILTGISPLTEIPAEYRSFSAGYSGIAGFEHYQKGRSSKYLCQLEGFGIYTCRFETDEELNARLAARRAHYEKYGNFGNFS